MHGTVLASSQGNLWYILGRLPQLSLSYGGPEDGFTFNRLVIHERDQE